MPIHRAVPQQMLNRKAVLKQILIGKAVPQQMLNRKAVPQQMLIRKAVPQQMLNRKAVPQQNKLAKRHSREGGNPVLFAYFKVLNTTEIF